MESEARITSLAQVEKYRPCTRESFPESAVRSKVRSHRHFFVIDATMAVNVLEKAWQYEYATQGFYE